eukprot:5280910-Amphidinium_carterae.1
MSNLRLAAHEFVQRSHRSVTLRCRGDRGAGSFSRRTFEDFIELFKVKDESYCRTFVEVTFVTAFRPDL